MPEELLNNPMFQDLLEDNQRMAEKLSAKDISKIKIPYIKKNKLLMAEGVHNGIYYPATELENVRLESSYGLFFDHNDGASTQVGVITTPHWSNEGEKGPGIYGDLEILERSVAEKLEYGFKWGLSPTVDVDKNETDLGEVIASDPIFLSWSLVLNPAVRATMLNRQTEGGKTMELDDKQMDLLAEKLAKRKKKDEEKDKDKLGQMEKENKELKERLNKIEEAQILKESQELLEKEIGIGKTADAQKVERMESLKKLSSEERKVLSESYDWMISSLELDADENPEKYLEDTKGLSEQELSAYTEFVKKFLKTHKGAKITDAAKAYKKEKMAVKKKYPYPYPKEDEKMGQAIDARQSLSSVGSESGAAEELNDDPHAGAKEMLQFMRENQGGM